MISLKIFKDKRGEFLEILKTENSGQFSFFTITPKKIRGEHYHNTKFEKFLVVKGRVLFKFKHLFKNKIYIQVLFNFYLSILYYGSILEYLFLFVLFI
jgi:dTDP-4-dehydrorhamnose 3,5-epimerase-like enzyme